jgi:ketosteroid isomerase-like protein
MANDDNLELIQRIYSAYAQGDSQFILDRVTDDVDWINEGPDSIPYAGRFKGPKEVQRFFEALGTTVDNGRVTPEDWIVQGDKVVSTGRFTATVKATGRRIDVPIAHVFTVRNGKVVRWVGYADTARVAEAYATSGKAAAS